MSAMHGGDAPALELGGAAAAPQGLTRRGGLLCLLYFLSGVTALGYEVLWVRMLSLQFGISIFGVVVTAAAFMAGLGTGALGGARLAATARAPLRLFALLEAAVAVYALALPAVNAAASHLLGHAAAGAGLYGWYALQCTAALLLLAVPAAAMGAGFALMLRAARGTGAGVASLYGINTLGGVAGALLPLWLLPALGWSRAVQTTAGLGLAVAAVAALASRPAAAPPGYPDAGRRTPGLPYGTYAAYAGVGAAALALEVGWTRLFGMILLRTEYVMAVILAVFLLGIGAGSLLARRTAPGRRLNALPALAAAFALGSLWALPALSRWAERSEYSSLASAMAWQGGAIAAVTLPVTLVLGAWLPLLAQRLGDPVRHGTRLYAVNAAGGAAGALLAGFVLIPWLGTAGTVCAAAALLFACGMAWAAPRWWVAAVPLALLAVPVRTLPPVADLLPAAHGGSRDLYVHEDAISTTHVVQERDGQRVLLSDLQRMDASTSPSAVALQRDQSRLPLMLHPSPRRVLFLGLGTGITASGSLPFAGVQRRVAVELSRGAIAAAPRWFAPVNGGAPARMQVVWSDARRFLQADHRAYDVIIGDVFHPDLVGRSSLLSVQQFRRARARLAPGGLFVQWLALNQFDPQSLAVVMRSFQRVFPGAVGFIDGFRFAMVGPRDGLASGAAVAARLRRAADPGALTGGEGVWTWLGRYWGPLDQPPGPVQDEWSPVIEFSLPRARFRNELDTATVLRALLRHRPDVDQAEAVLAIPAADREAFERAYIATELGTRSWLATIEGDDMQAQRLLRLAYEGNPHDRWIGFSLADRMFESLDAAAAHGLSRRQALEAILRIRPDHTGALRALADLEQAAGRPEQARLFRERLRAVSPLGRK